MPERKGDPHVTPGPPYRRENSIEQYSMAPVAQHLSELLGQKPVSSAGLAPGMSS